MSALNMLGQNDFYTRKKQNTLCADKVQIKNTAVYIHKYTLLY